MKMTRASRRLAWTRSRSSSERRRRRRRSFGFRSRSLSLRLRGGECGVVGSRHPPALVPRREGPAVGGEVSVGIEGVRAGAERADDARGAGGGGILGREPGALRRRCGVSGRRRGNLAPVAAARVDSVLLRAGTRPLERLTPRAPAPLLSLGVRALRHRLRRQTARRERRRRRRRRGDKVNRIREFVREGAHRGLRPRAAVQARGRAHVHHIAVPHHRDVHVVRQRVSVHA